MISLITYKIKPSFSLSLNWYGSTDHIIKSLKTQSPQFFTQNGSYIFNHLINQAETDNWHNVHKFVSQIDLIHVNKWELRTNFAYTIKKYLQSGNFTKFDNKKLQQMLSAIALLKYEPHPKKDVRLYEEVEKRIKKSQEKMVTIMELGTNLLLLNPEVFQPYRQQLQKNIEATITSKGQVTSKNMRYIILDGIKSQFWSWQFSQKLEQFCHKNYLDGYTKSQILFSNSSKVSITTKPTMQENYSLTERKIGDFLEDIGYIVQRNIYINHMEFDLLLPGNIIIQYNGLTHYKINSSLKKPALIYHDQWKRKILKKFGYFVIDIPFYRWQTLLNEKQQKQYLIRKIEGDLIRKEFGEKVYQNVFAQIDKLDKTIDEQKGVKFCNEVKNK